MIEEVLYPYLCKSEQLASLLATHDGEPAIFQQIAPEDTDKGWDGVQFSRIVYDIDKTGNVERKISGTLYMDVMCSGIQSEIPENIESVTPEDIEKVLKELIDGYFFVVDGMTYAAKWERSDSFKTEPNHKVFGITVTFSLLAFPQQNTGIPDSVALMNTWTAAFFPNATIINVSATQPVFKPTNEHPAIYWSFRGLGESPISSIYHCTWRQTNLNMHVMAPSTNVQNSLVQQVNNALAFKSRIMFEDGTQFMLHSVTANAASDPIRDGQLTLQGSYPIIRPENDVQKLQNITNKLR